MFNSVLFIGRKECFYTKKLKNFLSKNSVHFKFIESINKNKKLNINKKDRFDYIFCFRSFFILKKKHLKLARISAINFHPGTPRYRGIGCINFALMENSKKFGSTCHIINEKIDNGKILDVKYFNLKKVKNLSSAIKKTHNIMFEQAKFIFKYLLNKNDLTSLIKKNKNFKWTNKIYTQKDLENLYKIDLNKNKKLIQNQIKSTYLENFHPYIEYDNKKFFLNLKK